MANLLGHHIRYEVTDGLHRYVDRSGDTNAAATLIMIHPVTGEILHGSMGR